jgi:hypothetical protein
MKYKYKIQYTIFVLLLCSGLGWLLNYEFDMSLADDAIANAGKHVAALSTSKRITHLITPAAKVKIATSPKPENEIASSTTSTSTETVEPPASTDTSSSTVSSSSEPVLQNILNPKKNGRRGR